MDTFKRHPYVISAEISWGGLFGKTEKRNFMVERLHDHIPARILVQQYEMRHLDKKGIEDMIEHLEYKVEELKEQLRYYEYPYPIV